MRGFEGEECRAVRAKSRHPARERGAEQNNFLFLLGKESGARKIRIVKKVVLRGIAAALRRLAAVQRRFRFLDLCIRFGKIISKV